eukprot:TRINITY_DN16116_c0_g1_i1.p1 TRINITY_DN16116_c0_g1~~TRINITY_DN16116_c0_g1_i1.p1  ORF type:complete len:506 (+),score=137.79 TRINITY_DN16116_c0_g1_i1:59-1519(+)
MAVPHPPLTPSLSVGGCAEAEPMAEPWGQLVPLVPRTVRAQGSVFDISPIVLTCSPFVIGRNPSSDYAVQNPAMSQSHCRLERRKVDGDEAVVICDTSRNGIWVRGRRLGRDNAEQILDGDQIALIQAPSSVASEDALRLFQSLQMQYQFQDLRDSSAARPHRQISALYVLGETIGRGAHAEVVRAKHRLTGKEVAVKVIQRRKLMTAAGVPTPTRVHAREAQRQAREIAILRSIRHPYLVHVLDTFTDDRDVALVLELARGGDMFEYLKEYGLLTESRARQVMLQLCSAVKYLHSMHIAHRDIKLENVLLAERGSLHSIRITDFGMSRVFATFGEEGEQVQPMHTVCGTPLYLAPEIARASQQGYNELVDIWSLGVLLWLLVVGSHPFARGVDPATGKSTRFADYTRKVDWSVEPLPSMPQITKVLQRMLSLEPEDRPSAAELAFYPWLVEDAELSTSAGGAAVRLASAVAGSGDFEPAAKRQRT